VPGGDERVQSCYSNRIAASEFGLSDRCQTEVGHHLIDPAGPECSCGFRGCWESLAAGPAMVAWLEGDAPAGYLHRSGITAKRICEFAQQGDEVALQAVEQEAYSLGLGLANLINLFTLDAVVLSGSVMKSAPLFLGRIRAVIRSGCRFVPAAVVAASSRHLPGRDAFATADKMPALLFGPPPLLSVPPTICYCFQFAFCGLM
jgi:predicted NBD/HSP70 family sugar kinase